MGDDRADRTLYVGNLENEVTEDILYELFLQAGPLVSIKRMADKPFAFVEFKHDVSVPYAKNIMTGTHLFKKEMRLQFRSGSIHQQQQSQRPSSQNYQRSNSYPNPHGQSFPAQSQFQGQDPRQAMYSQQMQGNFQHHGQYFDNGQQHTHFQDRNQQNNEFRRNPQFQRAQSFNEQEFDPRGQQGYDSGRSRHTERNFGGYNNRGNSMRNEPQEIIQNQMRKSAETGMRHVSRGPYKESRSGGHHYRR